MNYVIQHYIKQCIVTLVKKETIFVTISGYLYSLVLLFIMLKYCS